MNFQDRSLLELFALGGPIMWLLLALSAVGLLLFVERALYLHRGQIRSNQFLDGVKNIVAKQRVVEALTVAEETPGPVAAVVKAGLLHYEDSESDLRHAMTEAALVEIPALERRVGSLAAIAQAAPVLGLLGTVLGMIQTFHQFEQNGAYVHAGVLSGGFWQALLTTAAGLAIGVSARLGHHFLSGRIRALVRDMEWVGNDLLHFLLLQRRNPPVGTRLRDDPHAEITSADPAAPSA
ncbi:MotA/TolQ/ExbB proton channel family protein [Opitutales bacterium ASA1]|uniref:MotA/TolQ/ExbB proton channel family protein n=1 Tax=Congregicoccus parvus TaxID=3081749 RepID=UPI002B2DCC41|nr:MotA/TolQ/ExbB proton channel family protein [Opitutales bacterium ASA1]